MKNLIIAILLSISTLFAQDFKPPNNGIRLYLGGVNSEVLDGSSISKKSISGGIGYEWYLQYNLSITSGLFYVEKGFKKESIVAGAFGFFLNNSYGYCDVNTSYYYIEIPIMLNYNFNISNTTNLKIGTGLSWCINTHQVDYITNWQTIDTSHLSEEEFRNYPYDYLIDEDPGDLSPESSTFDFNLGINIEWYKFFAYLKYSQNISDGVTVLYFVNSRDKLKTLSFYIGYKF